MTNKKRFTYKPLWLALSSALLVQACDLTIETRNPKLDLPEQFNAKVYKWILRLVKGLTRVPSKYSMEWVV